MLEGGTAVDGAIAGLFCNGVYSSQVIDYNPSFSMNSSLLFLMKNFSYFRAWVLAEGS